MYGGIEALLAYPLPRSIKSDSQDFANRTEPNALETLLLEKAGGLGFILTQIESEALSRRVLSVKLAAEIDRYYRYLKTKLYELDVFPLGGSRAVESRRSSLEAQLDKLNEERRKEHVQCWQDRAKLGTEWRTWFKQYADLTQRMSLVSESGRKAVNQPAGRSTITRPRPRLTR